MVSFEPNSNEDIFVFLPWLQKAFWCFLFCFFMWFARFQILISEPQSIWRKLLVLSLLYILRNFEFGIFPKELKYQFSDVSALCHVAKFCDATKAARRVIFNCFGALLLIHLVNCLKIHGKSWSVLKYLVLYNLFLSLP